MLAAGPTRKSRALIRVREPGPRRRRHGNGGAACSRSELNLHTGRLSRSPILGTLEHPLNVSPLRLPTPTSTSAGQKHRGPRGEPGQRGGAVLTPAAGAATRPPGLSGGPIAEPGPSPRSAPDRGGEEGKPSAKLRHRRLTSVPATPRARPVLGPPGSGSRQDPRRTLAHSPERTASSQPRREDPRLPPSRTARARRPPASSAPALPARPTRARGPPQLFRLRPRPPQRQRRLVRSHDRRASPRPLSLRPPRGTSCARDPRGARASVGSPPRRRRRSRRGGNRAVPAPQPRRCPVPRRAALAHLPRTPAPLTSAPPPPLPGIRGSGRRRSRSDRKSVV